MELFQTLARANVGRKAFSLIEILAAVAILGFLAALLIILYPGIRDKFEGVRCVNNLRQLHTGFSAYVEANGHWPQEPEELWGQSDQAYGEWWIKETQPYFGSSNVWKCPTVVRKLRDFPPEKIPVIDYTPTMFDENRQTPFKWPSQPWFIEIGNMHGHGALICFPDGSVRPLGDVVKGAKLLK